MPAIFVWAVVTDERGVLLVPASEADGWILPGGPLLPADESVETAIVRELEARFGVRLTEEPPFLDTQYERSPDSGTIVHNLFHVPAEMLGEAIGGQPDGMQWFEMDALDTADVPAWLRGVLGVAFGGEPEPEFDLGALQSALGGVQARGPVVIVTGPAGAGKSSVARELCRRFPRAAHIELDALRRLVCSGYASPVPGRADPDEAERQTYLATRNAVDLALNFSRAGFVAVIDEVLQSVEEVDLVVEALGEGADARLITLLPDRETLVRRDRERAADEVMGARSEELRSVFAENGERRGLRLDTSAWDTEQTVDIILERFEEARVTGR